VDVTEDTLENDQKDIWFCYFHKIWRLFWTFWHCRINTLYIFCR